jgi:hypothetical protein
MFILVVAAIALSILLAAWGDLIDHEKNERGQLVGGR